MFSDKRNLEITSQTASLLVQDLQKLVKSTNPLLADIALEILQQAIHIEQRLSKLDITHTEENSV
jgi:hypothetical protein